MQPGQTPASTCNLVGVEEKHMQGELEHFCRERTPRPPSVHIPPQYIKKLHNLSLNGTRSADGHFYLGVTGDK
jgi:hypothetical protein